VTKIAKSIEKVDFLPLVSGFVSIILYVVYIAARHGKRYLQQLENCAAFSEGSGVLGVMVGLLIRRYRGSNRVLTIGILVSTIGVILNLIFPPL
jgi:uncharacterized membrane protein HdeD (DUF308 family)